MDGKRSAGGLQQFGAVSVRGLPLTIVTYKEQVDCAICAGLRGPVAIRLKNGVVESTPSIQSEVVSCAGPAGSNPPHETAWVQLIGTSCH